MTVFVWLYVIIITNIKSQLFKLLVPSSWFIIKQKV